MYYVTFVKHVHVEFEIFIPSAVQVVKHHEQSSVVVDINIVVAKKRKYFPMQVIYWFESFCILNCE